ncbi:hypothetical protein BGZ96_007496 [Linnemannia gamsii]|uniref:FAD-binding domain-containing protein n=1 Tax=Linnemannia gamsii TaxID=64522 RepID=A0ABQ7K0B1_9FUNG|nr:hypothetical protein BGZ96_007496 [Linnemannia gamsii]
MSIGPTLLPVFQQFGIYDDILSIGKYMDFTETFKKTLEPYRATDYRPIDEFTGYGQYIVARPKYYDIMLKQIPPHKIHFGKRVLSTSKGDNDKVVIHLNNNETFEGDILIGADGAYSAVRQGMYEQSKSEGTLPKSDQEELPFSCTCLVGQTKVLDAEEFPIINEPHCRFRLVLGDDKPYSITLCFMVIHHLPKNTTEAATEQRFRNSESSEWGAYPVETMCEETKGFPIELSDGKKRTMGDLYGLTPKELISKVMLEEKVFDTWYSGRTVLLGDACHKLNPSGGHGAVKAMHDAIALANLLYAMPTKTSDVITRIFEKYHKERHPAVVESFNNSQAFSKFIDRGIMGYLFLYFVTHMPFWLWRLVLSKTGRFRPQVGFIDAVPLKGTVLPVPSLSELKLGIYEEFISLGKYLTHIPSFKESNEVLYPKRATDFRPIEEFTGYGQYIIARPKLYELLYRQVPPHKIHLGKRVLNISEKENRVTVHLYNNEAFEGDNHRRRRWSLQCGPSTDWSFFTTTQNTLEWSVVHQLDKTTSKAALEQRFRNSENCGEWGAIPALTTCDETKGSPIPLNGEMKTMGDIYDLTSKELISKVMLEEKVFNTWHSGRTVLLGDACHKLNPSGGHGAVTALHDAIALANLLYAMPTTTSQDITHIFEEYQKERLPAVMASYKISQVVAKVSDRGIIGRLVLYLITHIPMWLWRIALAQTIKFRPQVGFIEAVGLMGSVTPVVSPSEQKARAEFERRRRAVPL